MRPAKPRSSLRFGAVLLLGLLTLHPTGTSAAPAMTVESATAPRTARLRLLWPSPVAATAETSAEGVLVSVDRDVDAQAVRDAATMLPDWIASAEVADRQIRIVPVAGRAIRAVPLKRGIELRLSKAAAAPAALARAPLQTANANIGADAEAPTVDDVSEVPDIAQAPPATGNAEAAAAERRLRLTRARLMMETGDPQGAKRELERLRAEVPNSIEVMTALAGVEAQLGSWRRALGLYDSILEVNPDDPALARAKAELLREHGPRFRLDFDHRKVKEADRQIVARATGVALAGMSTVGFGVEAVDLKTPAVRLRDGSVDSFQGRRVRGEAYVALDHDDASITRGSLIGGNGIVGAAIRHATPLAGGTARVGAIVQDPYWDVVDGLVNEARTDRVQVGYERLFGTDWRLAGRLSVGRYGIRGASDVAHFISPTFELAYTLYQGPPSITLAYGLDAEYLGRRKTAVDAFGIEYPLLSVVSREVHSGTVGLSGTFRPELRYSLFGGWAYDRLNADGPFIGAELAYEPTVNFEIGLTAGHSLATSRGTDATLTRIGGYLLWRF
jgi:tetratricopeptide (TPR) repeat protein